MNRELKFRAFDDGKMVYQTNALISLERLFRVIRQDAIVMQWTGLHDKNGKDGYHKDIVKSGKNLYIIEWQDEEARFWLAPCGKNTESWKFMDMLNSYEIIGNIFENSNLLNEESN